MRAVRLDAGFHAGPHGSLFETRLSPPAGTTAARHMLVIPPFGEEMNRSRRFLAVLARRLARAGWTVALPDLFGTGDSAGDFGDAAWTTWQDDIAHLCTRLEGEAGGSIDLLAVRTGCLLAAHAIAQAPAAVRSLTCVAPVSSGDRYLKQLLRFRVAAGMADGTRETTHGLRNKLDSGEPLAVGGYTIGAQLAAGLSAARLADMPPPTGMPVAWYEAVSPELEAPPAPPIPESWRAHIRAFQQVRDVAPWNLQEPPLPEILIGVIAGDLCGEPT